MVPMIKGNGKRQLKSRVKGTLWYCRTGFIRMWFCLNFVSGNFIFSDTVVKEPFMVLEGHRSIVNQVRYNHHAQALASSGVEKCVKVRSTNKNRK